MSGRPHNPRRRLEELQGRSWSVGSDKWEERFSHLKQFRDLKGNCRVSISYKTEFKLGVWVSKQRRIGKALTTL
jgi:Helicase associated domain